MILHTVNKSPFEHQALGSCLRLAADNATILLIEDAVYAALQNTDFSATMLGALQRHTIYALQADLQARGLATERLLDKIRITDYDGFVELSIAHDKVLAW